MKTFRQIADENNLNRTTIFKRAKKIPNFKAKHLTKKNGKWFVNSSGVKLLISHKNIRPRKYKSRINTKYDYWKRAKFLEDQNEWLRSRMDKLIANNTQLANNNQKLANRSADNQKQLAGQKSKPQPKIEDPWQEADSKRDKKQKDEIKTSKAKLYDMTKDKIDRHGTLKWLFNHLN